MNKNIISKENVLSAVSWHFTGSIVKLFFSFTIGVIIARLLTPSAYGVVGLATVFITITNAFVDSGFGMALIQKKECTSLDFSTVFYFNIFVSIVAYSLIFLAAGSIANFFHENQLITIIRVLGILIIFDALNAVQLSQLKKKLNYKFQTLINIASALISGGLGIFLAYNGYGAWSLIWQAITNQSILVVGYWISNKWRPKLEFSFNSLKSLFAFGSRLLLTGIIYQLYNNLNSIMIAKFYSASELGLFTRADRFQQISSKQISGTMAEITFPLFSNIQDDKPNLKKTVRYSIKAVMFVSTPLTFSMMILAKLIILGLIGERWQGSIQFLQLLCIYGLFYPIIPIITNIINALGKSDLFLKLEIVRRVMDVPVLFIGAFIGIKEMICVMIIVIMISIIITMRSVHKLIDYSIIELLSDIKSAFLVSLAIGIALMSYLLTVQKYFSNFQNLTISILISTSLFFIISEVYKINEYLLLKGFVINRLKNFKK
ncbi:MAG: hypothetical protein A2455_15835 [Ignavibacteria bacterium RIFOXYC2_FULL_35_16]|nr:MAG: hypothetical protein A2X60_16080 [Ignavibacteria bacterium GWF2_35_20]OGU79619.1 MAG: hypothetical protein A2254_17150 [Ignavibacteria bacterium RIFOXYA2_FULL_35_9]OGU85766.1 MAG: hypothetical protein A3K31_00760 [Ignavibacteria bacterium RIFOXYA12_FULL_35_25]OGU93151.1 MAG: hypothetical protein A2347_08110 [Ignavibacteria bacterium RIFOXYB12_FULL_35_14]OGU98307.1 MAG: hypothetical protein A2455_15835 [Ignavibacteria bacterium RIFOXYC2_FULL_35_16]OGV31068.1 MAG: hypothetical protein A2